MIGVAIGLKGEKLGLKTNIVSPDKLLAKYLYKER
jgi:heterodisulfide reductase subunit B